MGAGPHKDKPRAVVSKSSKSVIGEEGILPATNIAVTRSALIYRPHTFPTRQYCDPSLESQVFDVILDNKMAIYACESQFRIYEIGMLQIGCCLIRSGGEIAVEVRDGVSLAALGAFLAVWLQNR
jgi:hypothetical protein